MYDLYKPLRNYLRTVSLLPSLLTIYRFVQHLQFQTPLPPALQYPMFPFRPAIQSGLFEWTLELLARELILNAPDQAARAIDTWNDYAKAGNIIRDIENKVWGRLPNGQELIRYEMVRIAHRQFAWQTRPNQRLVASYLKLYSNPRLTDLMWRVFGMTAHQLMQVGMGLAGHFLEQPTIRLPVGNQVNEVDDAVVAQFVARFSRPLPDLRVLMQAVQAYNVNWAYAFDPLRSFPMIRVADDRLFCPMPTLLLWRVTEGVYFDLVKEGAAFDRTFGPAFQDLAAEVVAAADPSGHFETLPEVRYGTKAKPKDSVDLIVQDETGVLFVECKASRFKAQAKVDLVDLTALLGELDRLAGFVAQVYATLADALARTYPHWKPDGRPIYPLVLTLDEWLPSGRMLNEAFEAAIREKLAARGVTSDILEQHPFTLCSLQEFELAVQVMATDGIAPVMAGKTQVEQRTWAMGPYLNGAFAAQIAASEILFVEDWQRV